MYGPNTRPTSPAPKSRSEARLVLICSLVIVGFSIFGLGYLVNVLFEGLMVNIDAVTQQVDPSTVPGSTP